MDVRQVVEIQRQTNVDNYINTLTGKEKTQALLLQPTFTGWPDDLETVLANLERSSAVNQNCRQLK